MQYLKLANLLLLVILLSCKNRHASTIRTHNDTTFILNQALTNSLSVQFMPDADVVTRPYDFNDSILLTSSVISLDLLPVSIGVRKFKVLNESEILKILRNDSDNLSLPNYLKISQFEPNDSGYYVQVQNLSALPFGGGGILGLYYLKKGDSIVNAKRMAASIN